MVWRRARCKELKGQWINTCTKEILENVMLPYAEENLPLFWKFQQDNDPKHAAKSVKMWFSTKNINVLEVARTVTRPKSDRKFVGGR